MTLKDQPYCYVAMPFGLKKDEIGAIQDFDEVYARGIRPALDAAGLLPLRADALLTSGSIHKAIIGSLIRSEAMVADVTTNNPNVLYELGLRHGISQGVTVLICAQGSQPAFDISGMALLTYPSGENIDRVDWTAFVERLGATLTHGLESGEATSPVFTYFPDMIVEPPPEFATARSQRSGTRRADLALLRARLLEARQLFDKDKVAELEDEILAVKDPNLLTDLMLAYRDCGAWSEMVEAIRVFPTELANQTLVMQQHALALNRLERSEEATQVIQALIGREGGSSETFGLLGRIYKDRWTRTGEERFRDLAIDAYRRGFEADPTDYYPGINLLNLLSGKQDEASVREFEELLPELRSLLGSILQTGRFEYWDVATGMELAALAGDWSGAEELVSQARARATADWMIQTTSRNLGLVRDQLEHPNDKRRLGTIIRQLESSDAGTA